MLRNSSPYDRVSLHRFTATEMGQERGYIIFKITLSTSDAFSACVFRDHFCRFLLDDMEGDWHLGNDDKFIRFSKDDLTLAIQPIDLEKIKTRQWLNHRSLN